MSIAMTRTADDAKRQLTRIRLTAGIVRDNLPKLQGLIMEAKSHGDDAILGYESWTAYISDAFSDEPMRLPRDERQLLVAMLAGEGMSTRAIAPIVGASVSTIKTDVQVARIGHLETQSVPEPTVTPDDVAPAANPITGELLETGDGPTPVDEAPPVRTVTGLDGKSYTQPERKASKPTAELSIVNDVRLYLRNLARSPHISRLSPAGKHHIITALQETISQLEGTK